MTTDGPTLDGDRGHAFVALLVSIAIMTILMTAAMPVWRKAAQREREEELIFRGEQYAHAISLFQRKFAGAFPPSVQLLVDQKFLRRAYKDPITNSDFQVLYQTTQLAAPGMPGAGGAPAGAPGAGRGPTAPTQPTAPTTTFGTPGGPSAGPTGGIVGVTSKSKERSIKIYNGRNHYNEWQFVYTVANQRIGAPGGAAAPGMPPGAPGSPRPGMPPGAPGGPGGPFGPAGTGAPPRFPMAPGMPMPQPPKPPPR